MKQKILLSLFSFTVLIGSVKADLPVCFTNAYGEQATLILTSTGDGNFSITGYQYYAGYGSTLWPITGTFNDKTQTLHYVATNPAPDNCTYWANSVTFDFIVKKNYSSGTFSNDCGYSGSLFASGVRGRCALGTAKANTEGASTASHQMIKTPLNVPPGEDLLQLLQSKKVSVFPNPAVQSTQISFTLDTKLKVSVRIYDQYGNLTRTVAQGTLNEGKHSYTWNLLTEKGNKATKGFYWIKVTTDTEELTQHILVQ